MSRTWLQTGAVGGVVLCTLSLGCGAPAADSGVEGLTYCDVEPIIQQKCVRCHSEPREHGEPFTLETYDEIFERRARVELAVREGFMPYTALDLEPPVQDLTEEERDMIVQWLEEGAADGGCD